MAWAILDYPWQAALAPKGGSVPEEGIRPDNGAGLLVWDEPEDVLERLSGGLHRSDLSDGRAWFEFPGPSFRRDGAQDLTILLPGDAGSRVMQYQNALLPDPHAWQGKFHGLLTNGLQELSDHLYEARKAAYDPFLEKALGKQVKAFFTTQDDDFASRALICVLAKELPTPIQDIVERPRRLLRRKHAQVGLDRLQEMDITALIDYARRPGQTPAIKAGDRQRLMAVVREESADTLENRVVHDLCRRARIAGIGYVAEECFRCPKRDTCNGERRRSEESNECSRRVKRVDAFARRCEQFLLSATLTSVTSLTAPCRMPNYALQQNVRYMKVWDAYQRLLRQEDIRDQTWRWKRRSWTDYVRVCMMEAMRTLTLAGKPPAFRASEKPLRIRKEPQFGCWLKAEPFDGPLVFEKDGHHISLYLFNREDVSRAPGLEGLGLDRLNADLYWIAASTDWPEVRAVPIWTLVGDGRWQDEAKAKERRADCLNGIEAGANTWWQSSETDRSQVTVPKLLLIRAAEKTDVKDHGGRAVLWELPPDKAMLHGEKAFFKTHIQKLFQESAS